MKFNVSQVLVSFTGEPMTDTVPKKVAPGQPAEDEKVPLTLGAAAIASLTAQRPQETVDGKEKLQRFILAQLISKTKDGQVRLETEDLSLIKELIGRYMPIVVAGAAWVAIENPEQTKSTKPVE